MPNPKIDIHTHILPPRLPDLKARYGYGGFVRLESPGADGGARMVRDDGRFFRDIGANTWDPAERLRDMERCGVGLQVLSTVPVMFSYWAKPEHALDLARLLNDHIASVVRDHPGKFAGLGTLPLQSTDLAVVELERCVRELGLTGVQIGSHVNGKNLDDPALFPVWEAASALGAAVFVHPWDMLSPERMEKYWLAWLVGMPAELALAISSLIFGGVFERLPRLRVAFAHGGGAFGGLIGRLEQGFKTRPDLCAVSARASPRTFMGRFYVDSLVHDPRMLAYLIGLLGKENILLGSDYPFVLGEAEPGRLIESLPELSRSDQDRLLSGNALKWLGKTKEILHAV